MSWPFQGTRTRTWYGPGVRSPGHPLPFRSSPRRSPTSSISSVFEPNFDSVTIPASSVFVPLQSPRSSSNQRQDRFEEKGKCSSSALTTVNRHFQFFSRFLALSFKLACPMPFADDPSRSLQLLLARRCGTRQYRWVRLKPSQRSSRWDRAAPNLGPACQQRFS